MQLPLMQDGTGRNSPFTESLIRRIKEPGLEIATMFRRVAKDVFDQTHGIQMPELSISLLTDYFLNPTESDNIAWSRVRDSNDPADFKDFIRRFPTSQFARDAQYRVDLFERIRRENEEAKKEAERLVLAAEKNRQEEEAKKETERLALSAEKNRHEEEAKREAERLALAAEEKRQEEAAEAQGLQAEKRAADERAKVAAREDEDRKKQDAELEKQRTAEICNRDLAKLKELTATLQTVAIQNLAKETACRTMTPAIESALGEVPRGVKRACDVDRKILASLKDNNIGSLKIAVDHMSCETVRAEAQQRVATLEDEMQRKQSVCADEKTKLDAIDESASRARQQYSEFLARAECPSLRAEVNGITKKIDSRVKEAQTELVRLGCYNTSINGKFDEATKKSLALYHSKKGSLADSDHLTDGLLSALKQQILGLCPDEKPVAPVIATPVPGQTKGQANKEEEARPNHKRHKIDHASREEEQPVARPPKHRAHSAAREEEWAPRPHHRPEPKSHSTPVSVGHAPRMPMSPSASGGSPNVIGVGN